MLSEVDKNKIGRNKSRDLAARIHQEWDIQTQNQVETNIDQDAADHSVSLGAPLERGVRERPHGGRNANAIAHCYGNGGDGDEGNGDEGDGNKGDGNRDFIFALESLYHHNVSIAFKSSYSISLWLPLQYIATKIFVT